MNLITRKAKLEDLPRIIELLLEDDLGKIRESCDKKLNKRYIDTFHKINDDPNQYLMVVESDHEIIATCHLTIMPSLTFIGSTRMQIEAVRVAEKYRGKKVGEWMFKQITEFAKNCDVAICRLMTNKERSRAKHFYEKLDFESSHEGMKLYLEKE